MILKDSVRKVVITYELAFQADPAGGMTVEPMSGVSGAFVPKGVQMS